jgi:hypothetical protein
MKKNVLFAVLLSLLSNAAFTQKTPLCKVYAYSQAVLPGTKPPVSISEGGIEIKHAAEQKMNYYLYVELKKNSSVKIISMWLNGKSYSFNTEPVNNTPVELKSDDPSANVITLVPATVNTVVLLSPGKENIPAKKPAAWLKKPVSASELVLVYQWKGKLWYAAVSKITALKPAAAI